MSLFNRLTGFADAVKGAVIKVINNLPRPQWTEIEQWKRDNEEGNPLVDDRDLDRVEAPRRGLRETLRKTVDYLRDKFLLDDNPGKTDGLVRDAQWTEKRLRTEEESDGGQTLADSSFDPVNLEPPVPVEQPELTPSDLAPPPPKNVDIDGEVAVAHTEEAVDEYLASLPRDIEIIIRVFTQVERTDGSSTKGWRSITPITTPEMAIAFWRGEWTSIQQRYQVKSMEPYYFTIQEIV